MEETALQEFSWRTAMHSRGLAYPAQRSSRVLLYIPAQRPWWPLATLPMRDYWECGLVERPVKQCWCSCPSRETDTDAVGSHLAYADRWCATSTALICPLTPSWEHKQHQSTERLALLLLARHRLETASTGTATWCSRTRFQFYLLCRKKRRDPKMPS